MDVGFSRRKAAVAFILKGGIEMKKLIFIAILILMVSSICFATPSIAVYQQNRLESMGSKFNEKANEDGSYLLDLIKNKLAGKAEIKISSELNFMLKAARINDIGIAERSDILTATKGLKEKYIMLLSLREDSAYTFFNTNLTTDIQCRIIDVAENRYLLNMSEKTTDTTSSFRKVIKKTVNPILAEIDKIQF